MWKTNRKITNAHAYRRSNKCPPGRLRFASSHDKAGLQVATYIPRNPVGYVVKDSQLHAVLQTRISRRKFLL